MSKLKLSVLLKIAGLCGVIAPIISLSFIAFAIAYSPWFNWFKNALSDLGVGEAAPIFNSGLIIGGVLTTIFAVGLKQILKKQVLGFLGTLTLILAALSLCAIGLFPESAGRIHLYVSISFFALLAISLLIIGAALVREASQRYLGLFSILTIVIAVIAAWAVPHEGAAIPEIIGSLAASVWSIIFGIKLFKTT
jgi:hypothetical membrane protein